MSDMSGAVIYGAGGCLPVFVLRSNILPFIVASHRLFPFREGRASFLECIAGLKRKERAARRHLNTCMRQIFGGPAQSDRVTTIAAITSRQCT